MATATWDPALGCVRVVAGDTAEALDLPTAQVLNAALTAAIQQGAAATSMRACRACLGKRRTTREDPCSRCEGSGLERGAA